MPKSDYTRWLNYRKHFYGAAAEAMRRILVEVAPLPDERLLGVHEVLDQLAKEHPMDARIVKLRFFGGLKQDEIASLLEVSEKTVQRHWTMAKTWLYRALKET